MDSDAASGRDESCNGNGNGTRSKNDTPSQSSLHPLLAQSQLQHQPRQSPQPPRVMSIKERKKLILSRRKKQQSQSQIGTTEIVANIGGNHNLFTSSRKRRRVIAPIPQSNGSTSVSISKSIGDRKISPNNSMLAPSFSQSSQSQSIRYHTNTSASGNSESQVSGSLFANLGLFKSRSASASASISVGGKGRRSDILSKKRIQNEHDKNSSSPGSFGNGGGDDAAFKSPQPNLSSGKLKTPSSLFGEIMKRTQWESSMHLDSNSSTQANGNVNGSTKGNSNDDEANYFKHAFLLDVKEKRTQKRFQPPPILRAMSYDHDTDGDSKSSLDTSIINRIDLPPSSNFRISSLKPALEPRRRNIFKQYSKSSKVSKPIAAEVTAAKSSFASIAQSIQTIASPPRKSILHQHSSPKRASSSKSHLSDYGTPQRPKYGQGGNHVIWDPQTPTYKGALFRKSPKTPDNGKHHKTPPSRKKHVNWDPRTPDTQKKYTMTPNGVNRYYNSPGGFALQRVLDGCMSPQLLFNKQFDEKKVSDDDNVLFPPDDKEGSRSSVASLTTGEMDSWNECWLRVPSLIGEAVHGVGNGDGNTDFSDLASGEVGVVDWSIKSSMLIECNPGNCIPGQLFKISGTEHSSASFFSFTSGPNQSRIERMALDIFMNSYKRANEAFASHNIVDHEQFVSAQWQAATMFWQHPAIHPLPPSLLPNPPQSQDAGGRRSSLVRSSSIDTMRGLNNSKLPAGAGALQLQRQMSLPVISESHVSTSKASEFTLGMIKQSKGALVDTVRGVGAPLRQSAIRSSIGSLGGLGGSSLGGKHASTTSIMLQQRKEEWQECFRLQFFKWISRIHELNERKMDTDYADLSLSSRICFYSISPDKTVLFRASTSSCRPKNDTQIRTVEPMIILSSSTQPMRSCMRAFGIALKILKNQNHSGDGTHVMKSHHQPDQPIEVTEQLVEQWLQTTTMEEDAGTSQVQEELEALRRATAHGESVGAEVSISHPKKTFRKKNHNTASSFPPLIIRGHDDCLAFYEIFLNSYGSLVYTSGQDHLIPPGDVPLLVSRSLGPAKHMSLRRLSSSIARNGQHGEDQGQTQADTTSNGADQAPQPHQISSVELSGPIVPCAVQDLLCAAASHFSLHKKLYSSPDPGSQNAAAMGSSGDKYGGNINVNACDSNSSSAVVDTNIDENILGSHYFMMQLRNFKGNDTTKTGANGKNKNKHATMAGRMGSAGTGYFNGLDVKGDPLEGDMADRNGDTDADKDADQDSSAVKENANGEVTTMAVWDVNRPFSIAYQRSKVDDALQA